MSFEYRIAWPDGTIRWIHDRGFQVRDRSGKLVRLAGIARDITAQKTAEEALRRREEYFRLLIENAADLISVVNRQGLIRFQSPSIERLLGYRPGDLIGHSTIEFVHSDDIPKVTAAIQQAVADPTEQVSMEYRKRRQDGQW